MTDARQKGSGSMNLTLYPLGDYIQLLQKEGLLVSAAGAPLTREVALVSCDSRQVAPGTLFICKGAHFKEEFLRAALGAGAFAYLAEKPYGDVDAPCLQVTDVRSAMALLADFYYNHPSSKLGVVGITGTKGKSSTTYYLKYIFDEYLAAKKQAPSGVISSIETFDGVEKFESHLTTPEPLDLERHFAHAVESKMRYLTMEVSSQALKYDRVMNVEFAAAVFLNIGLDHISPIEHPDFEDYFSSKLRIFRQAAAACVNLDSDHADRVLEAARRNSPRIITFSQRDPSATIFGSQVRKQGGDILFRVKTPRYSREFRLTMPGLFNVQNALAALAVCEALGIPEQYAYAGLMKARVPGRMEVYANADEKVSVIVDYAHNRMSFETLFKSVKEEYPGRRIVAVFGCPGYKAYDRRKDLGEISGKYSDLVILTEEDAGEEPVENICRDIAQYVEAENCDYSIVPDRGEAVRLAVMGCEEPTVILLTGKGAETRQKRGIEYVDTPSDVEYSKKYLHEYDVQHGMDGMSKVRALLDVLPLLRRYEGKTIVIKYGGATLDTASTDTILEDAAALQSVGVRVVLVHGGGKEITTLLDRLGVPTQFEKGYRVTDEAVLDTAEMALSAKVNKAVVAALDKIGAGLRRLRPGRRPHHRPAEGSRPGPGGRHLQGGPHPPPHPAGRRLPAGGLPHLPGRGRRGLQLQRRRRSPGGGRGGEGGQAGLPHRHRRHPGGQPEPVHPHRPDGREPGPGADGQRPHRRGHDPQDPQLHPRRGARGGGGHRPGRPHGARHPPGGHLRKVPGDHH